MKKFYFLALALFATAFVGCKDDQQEIDKPVVVTPEVTLEAGETTETTIAFTVTTKNAEAAAYVVYEGETAPTADDILANGTAVELNKAVEVTVENLAQETTYNVIAAARTGEEVALAESIELVTLKGDVPPPGPTPDELKVTKVEGGLTTFQNYRLWVHLNNEGLIYFDVICPDSEHNILPAHEYPVVFMNDAEAEVDTEYEYYVHGDGSSYQLGYDSVPVRSGMLTVTHLETEGYGLDIDIVLNDEDRTEVKLTFEGVIPASAIGGDFSNPPYVEPEKNEVEVTITEVGAAFGNEPGNVWYFWFDTTDEDAYDAFLMLAFPKVTDGVLPEATYTFCKDYSEYQDAEGNVKAGEYRIQASSKMDSHIGEKATDSYIALVEGTTLTVEHDVANKAYILTLNLVGENGVIVKSTYTATAMRTQWDWEGANEFKFPGEGGAEQVGYNWEYFKGRVYNMANFALMARTIEQDVEFFFDMYCPQQTQKVLPAATYTVGNSGDYTVSTYSTIKLPGMEESGYPSSGEVIVEHVNGVYKITCDITVNNGAKFEFVYEGRIEDGVGEGFINPGEAEEPTPGPEPQDGCVVKGDCDTTYAELWFFDSADATQETIYLSMQLPGSIMNIIPEGEYQFLDTDAEGIPYVRSDWSASYIPVYANLTTDGLLTIKHTDNGYDITLRCVDTNGVEYNYTYVGPLAPTNDWATINNPPIPYDENTYNVEFTQILGSANSGSFSLLATTADNYTFNMYLQALDKGYDGIIPEGEYVIGGTDYKASEVWVRDDNVEESERMAINFTEGTITVAHMAEGYKITLNAKNLLKTTYVATFEGLIGTQEYAQYPFENPGVVIPAYWDFVFTTCTYGGLTKDNEGNETIRYWDFTNADGDLFSLRLDAKFTENGIVAGTYASCYGFESWYGYTPGQQKFSQSPLDPHDSPQEYPFWISNGAFDIVDAGDGEFNLSWSGYLYVEGGNKKVNISYTGAMPME